MLAHKNNQPFIGRAIGKSLIAEKEMSSEEKKITYHLVHSIQSLHPLP